jgi:hypothetical protein
MDPWNDHLSLMKTHNVPLLSAREKLPFEITPFMLHLTRESEDSGAAAPAGTDGTPPPSSENQPAGGGQPPAVDRSGQPAASRR